MAEVDRQRVEALGAAERVVQAILQYADHAYHGRPGIIVPDARTHIGVRWEPVTTKAEEDGTVSVLRLDKVGRKTTRTKVGVLGPDGKTVMEGAQRKGEFRPSGLHPEAVVYLYRQVADVYRMDQEFVARWASYAFGEDHRDLKVILAAFLLVQSRRGDPFREGDATSPVLFYDDDFRAVGEAMCLLRRADGKDLNPKYLLRIYDILKLPGVAAINRELGFGNSARKPFLGRWPQAVEKWLLHREQNPRLLEALVRAGFRRTVITLAQRVGYKPENESFFRVLRWKQKQSQDGRRSLAIGAEVTPAETWEGLDEASICQKIVATRPSWKKIVSLVPPAVGITRAVAAAAIESNCLSNADLIIATPTLEELGLLQVEPVKSRWEAALLAAENQRAANIASRVRKPDTAEKLEGAADMAAKKAVEEAVRGLQVYFFVDISGSMTDCIQRAKVCISKFLAGFPLEKTHVCVFNTTGREVKVPHASSAGVAKAFAGFSAGGGTDYGAGVLSLRQYAPAPDEDALFLFVGDEEASRFDPAVNVLEFKPVAFGLLRVVSPGYGAGTCVRDTATALGIPCFQIDEKTFDDPYAVPRTIRNLVAATPVGRVAGIAKARKSLVEAILTTDLLRRPIWAEPVGKKVTPEALATALTSAMGLETGGK